MLIIRSTGERWVLHTHHSNRPRREQFGSDIHFETVLKNWEARCRRGEIPFTEEMHDRIALVNGQIVDRNWEPLEVGCPVFDF